MTWKSVGDHGRLNTEIVDAEDGSSTICAVCTKQWSSDDDTIEPWPEGEANFRLILQAPQMLEALERMIEVYEAHFAPLPDGQQPKGVYTQARAAIAAVKGEDNEKA